MGERPEKPGVRRSEEDASREDALREHDRHHERANKAAETAVQAGQVAIRTAVLVNGGAAVSVLAFVGGLVGQGRLGIQDISTVADSLLWFAAGVACGVGSLGSSYLAQYASKCGVQVQRTTWHAPYVRRTREGLWWDRMALAMRLLGIMTGVLSLVLFVVGMLNIHAAITDLGPVARTERLTASS